MAKKLLMNLETAQYLYFLNDPSDVSYLVDLHL